MVPEKVQPATDLGLEPSIRPRSGNLVGEVAEGLEEQSGDNRTISAKVVPDES